MPSTFELMQQKKLERMRQGQQAASIETIPSDPNFRVAIVPLFEGEYDECMRAAASIAAPDNLPGAQIYDREERRQVVIRAAREVENHEQQAFPTIADMMSVLQPSDINHLYDCYIELSREYSPRAKALSNEEIDFLSELFVKINWKDLSGAQQYALARFLSLLPGVPQTVNLLGPS